MFVLAWLEGMPVFGVTASVSYTRRLVGHCSKSLIKCTLDIETTQCYCMRAPSFYYLLVYVHDVSTDRS